jgi:hypothetical protein
MIETATQLAQDVRAASQELYQRYARPDERKGVGRRVDPDTAHVWWTYQRILDPYDEGIDVGELDNVGRCYFAADPEGGVAVEFGDLPAATAKRLWARLHGVT